MATRVSTKQGVLVGARRKTQNGFEYDDFLNIPYAKPPVGDLRFKVINIFIKDFMYLLKVLKY